MHVAFFVKSGLLGCHASIYTSRHSGTNRASVSNWQSGHRTFNSEVVAMKVLCDHLAFPFLEFGCGGVVFTIWSWL
jgi:hypothetical protein